MEIYNYPEKFDVAVIRLTERLEALGNAVARTEQQLEKTREKLERDFEALDRRLRDHEQRAFKTATIAATVVAVVSWMLGALSDLKKLLFS